MRQLLVAGLLALLGFDARAADSLSSAPLAMKQIAEGVYAHQGLIEDATPQNRGDIANIGFVIGRDCAAVIDTGGSLAVGHSLLASLRRLTAKPVCYVINTHVHPDHVYGNAAFSGDAATRFVGNAKLPAALAARQDSYRKSLVDQIGPVLAEPSVLIPPTELIAAGEDRVLDLGDRRLTLHAWPTAHTDADLTVRDDKTDTLWTGDLLFVDRIPVIDGSLLGWLSAMNVLTSLNPKHVVPGHGPLDPAWEPSIANQARYLNVIASDVRSALKVNRTLQQTVERAGLSEHSRWRLFDQYNRRNVTTSYTELEWEN